MATHARRLEPAIAVSNPAGTFALSDTHLPRIQISPSLARHFHVVQINRYIIGTISPGSAGRRGVLFKLPDGHELAIRLRRAMGRVHFHGRWDGVPFTSNGTLASMRKTRDWGLRTLIFGSGYWWRNASVVGLSDEWDTCSVCKLLLSAITYPHGAQCPLCWSTSRIAKAFEFNVDSANSEPDSPRAVCEFDAAS